MIISVAHDAKPYKADEDYVELSSRWIKALEAWAS